MAKKARLRYSLTLAAVMALPVLFTGCKSPFGNTTLGEIADILAGVIAWARQDWPASVSHFLDSLNRIDDENGTAADWYGLYGLGSTYLAGDERQAALSRFESIGADAPKEITASVWYQRGIIAYRDGDYDSAALYFRRSIETGGAASDARVNMELSLRSRDEASSRSANSPTAAHTEPSSDPAADSIFNLIRKKEQDRWKNQESANTESPRVDY